MGWDLSVNLKGLDGDAYSQVFVQDADPEITNPEFTGPAVWYQTSGSTITSKKVRGGVASPTPVATYKTPMSQTEFSNPNLITTLPRNQGGKQLFEWAGIISGAVCLTYVYPTVTRYINTLTAYTAAVSGTPTLCRVGVYSVNPTNNDLTLMAAAPHDATLCTGEWTYHHQTLDSTIELVAGSAYAFAFLLVTSNPIGSWRGDEISWDWCLYEPRVVGRYFDQTDLPSWMNGIHVYSSAAAFSMQGMYVP